MLKHIYTFWWVRKWGVLLACLAFAVDMVSKNWALYTQPYKQNFIPGLVEWTLSFNKGVSFSFLGNIDGPLGVLMPYKLSILAVVASVFFLWWMGRQQSLLVQLGLGMLMGGALGNMVDRLSYGAVVDFISLKWGDFSFFICNGADIFISAGVCCILLDGFIEWRQERLANRKEDIS